MNQDVVKELNTQIEKLKEHFRGELTKLRTGRAHPSMVEDLMIEAYGQSMPLKTLATVSTPEPRLIQISVFDPSTVQAIATSIRSNQTLGLNPSDDGNIVRIQVPSLTEERRQLIVKQLGEKQEEAMISLRKARHEAVDNVNKSKKDKDIGEDDAARLQKQIDEEVNSAKADIEGLAKSKEQEILTV